MKKKLVLGFLILLVLEVVVSKSIDCGNGCNSCNDCNNCDCSRGCSSNVRCDDVQAVPIPLPPQKESIETDKNEVLNVTNANHVNATMDLSIFNSLNNTNLLYNPISISVPVSNNIDADIIISEESNVQPSNPYYYVPIYPTFQPEIITRSTEETVTSVTTASTPTSSTSEPPVTTTTTQPVYPYPFFPTLPPFQPPSQPFIPPPQQFIPPPPQQYIPPYQQYPPVLPQPQPCQSYYYPPLLCGNSYSSSNINCAGCFCNNQFNPYGCQNQNCPLSCICAYNSIINNNCRYSSG